MKTSILFLATTIILLFVSISLKGQLILKPDNIGIGTDSPAKKLHIEGDGEILRLVDSDGTGNSSKVYLSFYDMMERMGYLGFGSSTNPHLYLVADDDRDIRINAGSSKMFFSPLGNLLISKNSSFKVDVESSSLIKFGNLTSSPDTLRMASYGSAEISIDDNDNQSEKFFQVVNDGNATLFRVNDNGNVGVNTSSPSSRLHVLGNTKIEGSLDLSVGTGNVFIGENSGLSNITGKYNTAIGRSSMSSNTLGDYNVALGNAALNKNTIGYSNNAFGYAALQDNTEGNNNVANGFYALRKNTTGSQNIALGRNALYSNLAGDYNVVIGHRAGYSSTGDLNIFIGRDAGYNETGSNKLYIENSNTSTPLIYGEFDNNLLKINGSLSISDAFTFPIIDGADGQVMTTDGNGLLGWADIPIAAWTTNGNNIHYLDGSVGIGTNSPERLLHLKGDGSLLVLEGVNRSYLQLYPIGFSNGIKGNFGFSSTINSEDLFISNSYANGKMRFSTDGETKMVLDSDGNVGIGTTAPEEKLHVNGSIKGNSTGGAIKIQSDHGYIEIGPRNTNWAHIYSDRSKFIFNKPVISSQHTFSSYNNQDLILATQNGDNEVMRLKNNGDIITNGGIQLDNSSEEIAGMVRWTGTDFEGHDGNDWVSLTNAAPSTLWITITAGNSCYNQCPQGYVAAADVNGDVCKTTAGTTGKFVEYIESGASKDYMCGSNTYVATEKNSQCHCVKVQ